MNYIITNREDYFKSIGEYQYCSLKDMQLPKTIAYDSETEGFSPNKGEIFAIQIGTRESNYLIDVETIGMENIIPYLKNKILVIHNALFDLTWLYKYNFFPWKVRDTLLARKLLYNGVYKKHNFGTVMLEELNIKYDKTEQQNIAKTKLSNNHTIQYCFNDVDKLLDLADILHQKIIDTQSLPTYNLHCRWIRACAYMQMCGVPINQKKWEEKCITDKLNLNQKEEILKEYIIKIFPEYIIPQLDLWDASKKLNISLTSPLQMIPVFEKLGINVEFNGTKSIAENVIKKSNHPFVKLWLDYQSIKHDVTTFGNNFIPHIYQKRLYTTYTPLLNTARISAGGNSNINTLNIPANQKSREPFEALEGYYLIGCDYSGQETRVGADITQDRASIDSILNNKDLHCMFAKVIFPELEHLNEKEIKEHHSSKRDAAKSPRFCFQFGGSSFTLHLNENIPIERAEEIERGYKQLHAGIYEYGEKKLEESLKKGYIESIYGFKLYLKGFEDFKKTYKWIKSLSKEWWNKYKIGKLEYKKEQEAIKEKQIYIIQNEEAYIIYTKHSYNISNFFKKKGEYFKLCLNNPTQTTAAHQTKAALNKIFEYIWKNNAFWEARIALAVHDEIILEVVESKVKEYRNLLEKSMYEEGNKFITHPEIKMDCEAFIRKNWWQTKKAKKSDKEELNFI